MPNLYEIRRKYPNGYGDALEPDRTLGDPGDPLGPIKPAETLYIHACSQHGTIWGVTHGTGPVDDNLPPRAAAAESAGPDQFLCPITFEPMVDPVVAQDGQTYERAAIEEWLTTHDTSPLSGAVLEHRELTPNVALRQLIEEFHAD